MAQRASQLDGLPQEIRSALSNYLTELEKLYPQGGKSYQVVPWPEYGDGSYLVKVPSPDNEEQWLEISEQMADIGTHILEESDQLFILTIA
jgi:hypothetical protein